VRASHIRMIGSICPLWSSRWACSTILTSPTWNHNPPEANMSSSAPRATCGEHPPAEQRQIRPFPCERPAGNRHRSGSLQAPRTLPLPLPRRPDSCLLARVKGLREFQRYGIDRAVLRFSRNRCRMEGTGGAFRPPKLHPGRAIRRAKCTRQGSPADQSALGRLPSQAIPEPVIGRSPP